MRVQIMTDMEGVSGIVAWEQVNGGESMYEEGRRLYTEEINAAVRGAAAAGAKRNRGRGLPRRRRPLDLQLTCPRAARSPLRMGCTPHLGPLRRYARKRAATQSSWWACTPKPARLTACSATPFQPFAGATSGSTARRWARSASMPPFAVTTARPSCW